MAVAAVSQGGGRGGRRRRSRQCSGDPWRGAAKRHFARSVIVALLALAAPATSQDQEGDWCLNDDGYDGICRHLRHCPYLQSKPEVFNSAGASTPHLCTYGRGGPIVCCPTVTPDQPSPASTPSVRNPRPPTTRPPAPRPPSTRRPTAAPPRPAAGQGDDDSVVVEGAAGLRISERKCLEYMNSLDEETTSLRLGGDGLLDVWCPYPPPGNELIVGGTEALVGEHPHVAAIGYLSRRIRGREGTVNWLCGGSLISRNYVLTAAHCMRRDLGSIIAVSFGELRVTNMSEGNVKRFMKGAGDTSNIYPVADSLRHPKYSKFSHYDDIGLIRLEVPVRTFDMHVRPACLHSDPNMGGIQKAVACGFGHTVYQDSAASRLLRQVTLSMYAPDVCSQVFSAVIRTSKLSRGILDSQLCAGHLPGGKDTCDGDSGGPLQMRDKQDKCIIRIIGVTSFGTALCGSKNTAALYTNVAHYLDWIERIVWP